MSAPAAARYRYLSTKLAAPYTRLADLPLTGVEWERLRNGSGAFRGTLKLPPPIGAEARLQAAQFKEATNRGTACIIVLRDGVPMGAWIVWDQTYDASTQSIAVGGAELFSYFRRRIVESITGLTTPVSFENERIIDVATALVTGANDIGLVIDGPAPGSVNAGPMVTKSWLGTDAKWIADAVNEMANQQDGFDYRCDVRLENDFKRVLVLRRVLGDRIGATAKFGSTVPQMSVARRGDVRTNDTIALGGSAGTDQDRPTGRATSAAFVPKMQTVVQVSSEADPSRLSARADSVIRANENHEVISVDVSATDIDSQLGVLFPGDPVKLFVPPDIDPWFPDGISTLVRTIGFKVTVPDTGGRETIKLLVDDDPAALQDA